jgi:ketosteroid isomerase-like protein
MDGPLELARLLMENLDDAETAARILHPDIEWYGSVGGLEPGLARGREAVLTSFADYSGTWDGLRFEARSFVVDGDRVLALVTERARGMGSGVEVAEDTAILVTTEDGMIINIVSYLDLPRAYADFGIDPSAAGDLEPGAAYDLRQGRMVRR